MQKNILFFLFSMLFIFSACERKSPNENYYTTHRHISQSNMPVQSNSSSYAETVSGSSTKVKMKKENGVYMVPIKINGLELNFIFDSGAADITISSAEAIVLLKQGKLKEEDILGEAYYQIADGSIAAGTVINLRTVQIANKVLHNVQATVVDNLEAPLLLGQSALSRFGKISIDYNNSTIEFQ